jgi:hypothetical protein
VIGLRVKPKSLGGATFIERVQGATIETDGENVNLSDLIMKHDLLAELVTCHTHSGASFHMTLNPDGGRYAFPTLKKKDTVKNEKHRVKHE